MSLSDKQLTGLSAVHAQGLIVSGEISPVELLEACIRQVELINPALNAMVTTAFERARREALHAERQVRNGEKLGLLHGVPIAIKDIQNTEGIRTTYGSPDFANFVPEADSGLVARVRAAGGIVIGKTNVPEMSIGANTINPLFGPTGNAFNPNLTCGGSSGGSGVVVATNMVPLATGSDHGGSLRIPACYSGVVGYRATPGVVPNEQRLTVQSYYSVQGPMARSVEDAALLLAVISQRNQQSSQDPMVFPMETSRFAALDAVDVRSLRVAVTPDLGGVLVSDLIRQSFEKKVEKISSLVANCERIAIDLSEAQAVDWHLRQDIFVSQYSRDAEHWDASFNPNIKATYESALITPMSEIAGARRTQLDLQRKFAGLFEDFDLVICPGVSVSPFPWSSMQPTKIDGKKVDNYMAWLALTSSISVIGHPVLALPCGRDSAGLPFGIQVIGRMYCDHQLLSTAMALENAFATDPELTRPVPDFEALENADGIMEQHQVEGIS